MTIILWIVAVLLTIVGLLFSAGGSLPPTSKGDQIVGFCIGLICCGAALAVVAVMP